MICRSGTSRNRGLRNHAVAFGAVFLIFAYQSIQGSTIGPDRSENVHTSEPINPSIEPSKEYSEVRLVVLDAVDLAGELGVAGEYHSTRTILNLLLASNPNDAEKALIQYQYGKLYLAERDLALAASQFKSLLQLEEYLSPTIEQQVLFDLSKVYMLQEKTRNAFEAIKRWLENASDLNADEYFYVGQVHHAAKRYAVALRYVELAIRSAEQKKHLPIREDWLKLARYLNDKRGNRGRVSEINRILASRGAN